MFNILQAYLKCPIFINMSETTNIEEEISARQEYTPAWDPKTGENDIEIRVVENLERNEEVVPDNTRQRDEIMSLYQRHYNELMKINILIEKHYRYCICWEEFCLVANTIFAITFAIYFLKPKHGNYDSLVLLGEILFVCNTFCFGYGLAAIYKKCPERTNFAIKLLSIDFVVSLCLTGFLYSRGQEIGVILSGFGSITALTALIAGRGINVYFQKRKEIQTQLRAISNAYPYNFNVVLP